MICNSAFGCCSANDESSECQNAKEMSYAECHRMEDCRGGDVYEAQRIPYRISVL